MARLFIAAACTLLLLTACAGNEAASSRAAPPQTAEISCPDRLDRSIDDDLRREDLRNDVETQWPNGFGRPTGPMERERLFPDC